MPLTTLERDELRDLLRAIILTVDPDADVSDFSDWDIDSRILAELFHGNQHQAEWLARQVFLRTCDDSSLGDHARDVGTNAIPAQKSVGKLIVVGTAASVVSEGTRLLSPDGDVFLVSADATLAANAMGGGKLASEGSIGSRLVVAPDTSGMVTDAIFEGNLGYDGAASKFAIRGVLSGTPTIETYRRTRLDVADFAGGIALTANTGAVVPIIAEEAGAGGNKAPWSEFEWESGTPPGGVSANEPILIECGGGGDEESFDELRARLIAMTTQSSRSVDAFAANWVRWVNENPSVRVGRVYVFPNLAMLGVQTLVVEGVSGARDLPSEMLSTVEGYLLEVAPPAEVLDVRTRTLGTTSDVDMSITPGVGYEPDWGPTLEAPSTPGSFTTNAGSTTTRIELTVDPTGTIEVGDRVVVNLPLGAQERAYLREVAALGASFVDVTEALPVAPASGIEVLPGGPLTEGLIEAIESAFDDLGPGARSGGVAVVRYPDAATQGPYLLSLAALYDAVMDVDGVENVDFTTPAADVVPSALETVRLGELLMRYEAT